MTQIVNELSALHADSQAVLDELYNADEFLGSESSKPIAIDKVTRISPEQGALLRQLCLENNARKTLEIGFAYGFSTIWILDAQRREGGGHHVAIDPFERTTWGGVGISAVNKLSFPTSFELIEDLSIHVLTNFIKNTEKFDFIYIDGNHRFDDVMVDFYLSDQVLNSGGIIVLDDMWMPSIKRVAKFISNNRSYAIRPSPILNVSILKKLSDDKRNWDHFIDF